MCLKAIVKTYPKKDGAEGFGWKVFNKNKKGELLTVVFGIPIKRGKVYRRKIRKVTTLTSSGKITYDSGFHIFTNRRDARLYQEKGEFVVKVKYKGIVCDGYEYTNKDYNLKTRIVKQLALV